MVRHIPIHVTVSETSFSSPIPLAIGLFVSVTLVVALCAKHAKKYATERPQPNTTRAHLPSPKQMITTISQKAMTPLRHAKKPGQHHEPAGVSEEDGLWQKAIMMGDKCRPPEFSGVIYYDYSGNRIDEMPKSPRAGSMTPLRNFTFSNVEKNENST